MKKYSFKCSCGDVMSVEAADMDAAKVMLKGMMTEEAIAKHMAEKHAGQPVPTVADVVAQIDSGTYEDTGAAAPAI